METFLRGLGQIIAMVIVYFVFWFVLSYLAHLSTESYLILILVYLSFNATKLQDIKDAVK